MPAQPASASRRRFVLHLALSSLTSAAPAAGPRAHLLRVSSCRTGQPEGWLRASMNEAHAWSAQPEPDVCWPLPVGAADGWCCASVLEEMSSCCRLLQPADTAAASAPGMPAQSCSLQQGGKTAGPHVVSHSAQAESGMSMLMHLATAIKHTTHSTCMHLSKAQAVWLLSVACLLSQCTQLT